MTKLTPALPLLRLIHTVIWFVMVTATFYTFYSGISGVHTPFTWLAIVLIFIEGAFLILNRFTCPIHTLAQKLTRDSGINDTYMPPFIFFRGDKLVYSIFFFTGLFLILRDFVLA